MGGALDLTRFETSPTTVTPRAPIGVFDSGVGGLSVLAALRARLPAAPLLYVGDTAHAPYGERDDGYALARCERIVRALQARGARVIVMACNTATAVALTQLRLRWPNLAIVGVEPGVRPAATLTRSGCLAVLATPATARSARLRELIERHAAHLRVHVQACPGLAGAIERGMLDARALAPWLGPACDAVRAAGADTVVLGCTHYPFVAQAIGRALGPETTLVDTRAAVAERTSALWESTGVAPERADVQVYSTGATAIMARLLNACAGLHAVSVQAIAV